MELSDPGPLPSSTSPCHVSGRVRVLFDFRELSFRSFRARMHQHEDERLHLMFHRHCFDVVAVAFNL